MAAAATVQALTRGAGERFLKEPEAAVRAALNSGIGVARTLTNRSGEPPSARNFNITANIMTDHPACKRAAPEALY